MQTLRLPLLLLSTLLFAWPPGHPLLAQAPSVTERELRLGTGEWQVTAVLTMPAGASLVPAVLLVPGSGPADRDMTVGPNKLFRDVAQSFARDGIATLRFDKRLQVHGDLFRARHILPTIDQEYLDDAVEAARLLKHQPGVDPKRVYVFGHSQGATFAAEVARRAGGTAGVIVEAGSTRKPGELIEEQATAALRRPDLSPEDRKGAEEALAQGQAISRTRGEGEGFSMGLPNSYWRRLYTYNAGEELRNAHGRVLVLGNGRDNEVGEKDLQGFRDALAGRPQTTFHVFPSLNHLMQAGTGLSTDEEYVQPNHSVAPELLRYVADWIQEKAPAGAEAAPPPGQAGSRPGAVPVGGASANGTK